MRDFAVSALHEPPFPARRHEATDLIASESVAWARSMGLVDSPRRLARLRLANAAELAGRACPDAPVDRLRLLTDLITWLFVVDDACDEDGLGDSPGHLAPTVAGLLDVLDRHGDPAAPIATTAGPPGDALHDVCRRVRAHQRPALLLRFVNQLREYLLALLWEAANREHRRAPGVAEYLQMRRHTGGVRPSLTLTDLAYDVRAGATRRADPALVTLDALAADLVCWCNDLFSFGKEHRAEPDANNLVTAIARETGCDEATALLAAATRFNQALRAYAEGEKAALGAGDPAVAAFLAARRNWIRATYDWSLAAARYS
jgi:hypothetical protein